MVSHTLLNNCSDSELNKSPLHHQAEIQWPKVLSLLWVRACPNLTLIQWNFCVLASVTDFARVRKMMMIDNDAPWGET
jgi:hypothetical protein